MRISMKKIAALSAAALCIAFAGTASGAVGTDASSTETPAASPAPLKLEVAWDKTFKKSDKVEHSKVVFRTRYGFTLAADMYIPKNAEGRLPAIAVSGPFGAVKEQASGLYAQTLAEHGFLTIAFDPSYTGESSGEPRFMASPDINTEDFMAVVDFLSNNERVDPERIGIIGICGWGGMALNAAALDPRIKATVTSTMYNMSRVSANGYFDLENSSADRMKKKKALAAERTAEYRRGTYARAAVNQDQVPADAPQFVKDYHDYYRTPLGYHKRSPGSNMGWNKTGTMSFINQPIDVYVSEIESPVLMIHGEKAHSLYFSKTEFSKLTGNNKELYIVKGANHTDLYYKADVIPFAKIAEFFRTSLK